MLTVACGAGTRLQGYVMVVGEVLRRRYHFAPAGHPIGLPSDPARLVTT